jgi:hypothetical protein
LKYRVEEFPAPGEIDNAATALFFNPEDYVMT